MMASTDDLARYRYLSRLGSGGMATVVLAEDTLLGRLVALKRMIATADPRGVSRLRREALVGASVSHRNLVSVYDVITSPEGELVIVMEYVRGETMRDALTRQGRLPVPEALRILEGVAAGLDIIHGQGIVHRDVKPPNILLGEAGAVKVADLGIASVPDRTRITTTGSVLGSLSYMAPEQLADARSTSAIDVYALAAVAFEALSGRKARRAPHAVALAHAISTQPPPDLREAWPAAPAPVAALLQRGMARNPAARPGSAGELIGRLRAALEPESTAPIVQPRSPQSPAPKSPVPPPAVAPPASSAFRAPSRPPTRPQSAPRQRAPRVGGAVAAPVWGARGPDPDVPVGAPSANRGSRRRWLAGALAVGVAAAVLLAVALSSGNSPTRPQTSAGAGHRPAAPSGGGAQGRQGSPATQSGPSPVASATGSGTTPAGSATTPAGSATTPAGSATTPSGSATTPSGSATTPAGSGVAAGSATASTPVAAVESFYGLAAAHRYPDAWALADPTFQRQLGGYPSFQAGQAATKSISFDSANVVSQSKARATVAVATTSVQTDATYHCSGTVDLSPGGSSGGWQVHMIHIGCTHA